MKTIKIFIPILIAAFFMTTMYSCKKCKKEEPRARIINNGTEKANVQIQTSNGNTVNINNVLPNTTSAYSSYAAGSVKFTTSVNNSTTVYIVVMETCFEYDIKIDANNVVTSTPTDRNE